MDIFEQKWKSFLICERATPELKSTDVGSEDMIIRLPKFRISEQWGTPGSEDRKIIEQFTSKIQGATLKDKINSLNNFVTNCDAGCAVQKNVAEILANLVFLDSLASVIEDFNDKTGGFLFESLIASLFGGQSMQVPTTGGRYQDVTDIIDDKGRPMSLKFFFGDGSQYVKGSYDNLKNSIVKNKQPMYYLIGLKNREAKKGQVVAIDFYEFSVGSKADGIDGDYDVSTIGGKGAYVPRIKENPNYLVASLNYGSKKQLETVAKNYTERLGSVMHEIYQQLGFLSENINKYFLGSKDSALTAAGNASALKAELQKL